MEAVVAFKNLVQQIGSAVDDQVLVGEFKASLPETKAHRTAFKEAVCIDATRRDLNASGYFLAGGTTVKVTLLGHAAVRVETGLMRIRMDPVLRGSFGEREDRLLPKARDRYQPPRADRRGGLFAPPSGPLRSPVRVHRLDPISTPRRAYAWKRILFQTS